MGLARERCLLIFLAICMLHPVWCFTRYVFGAQGLPGSNSVPILATCGQSKRVQATRTSGVRVMRAALDVQPTDQLGMGTVVVASPENFGHMTNRAVALVFECGDGQKTKAVCLDKGLDFDVGDVITADLGPLADNRLFRGGEVRPCVSSQFPHRMSSASPGVEASEKLRYPRFLAHLSSPAMSYYARPKDGGSAAIMFHEYNLPGSRPVGDSGIFAGGFEAAKCLVADGDAQPQDFKFFFNYLSWPPGRLEEEVEKGLWQLVTLPNDVVLDARRMRDMELWWVAAGEAQAGAVH